MQTVEIIKPIPHEGLVEGDFLTVDELSAAKLIERGDAKAYEPDPVDSEPEAPVKTIDDIIDPGVARNRAVMTATVVGGHDPGPVAVVVEDDEPADAIVDGPADAPAAPADATGQGEVATGADAAAAALASLADPAPTGRAKRGSKSTSPELEAPAADAAGGDTGGGDSS